MDLVLDIELGIVYIILIVMAIITLINWDKPSKHQKKVQEKLAHIEALLLNIHNEVVTEVKDRK